MLNKRTKTRKACNFCRKKKIKCNGESPCSACIKHKTSCSFIFMESSINEKWSKDIKNTRTKRACSFCRIRKVKCDGNIPCSTCMRNNKVQDCDLQGIQSSVLKQNNNRNNSKYESLLDTRENMPLGLGPSIPISSSTGTNNVSNHLSFDHINLFSESVDIVGPNFNNRHVFGPLSWYSLVNCDKYMELIQQHFRRIKKGFTTINEDLEVYSKDSNLFRKKKIKLPKNTTLKNCTIEENIRNLDVSFSIEKYKAINLINRLKAVLPNRDVILMHINIFFDKIYPFIPILDEMSFRDNINTILGDLEQENIEIENINIRVKGDYAIIGILLIIMRFSSFSLTNSFSDETNWKKKNYHPRDFIISPEVFEVARSCLDIFDLYVSSDIRILQLLLFIRFYFIYTPEECDELDGRVAKSFNWMIVHMAFLIGLNRDPKVLLPKFRNIGFDNLCRKIWHQILLLDYDHCILFGVKLLTGCDYYDTILPSYIPTNTNFLYSQFNYIMSKLKELVNVVLDFKGCSIISLLEKSRSLEAVSLNLYKDFNFESRDSYPLSFDNVLRLKMSLNLNHFISSLYFKLVIYYEKRKNKKYIKYFTIKFLIYSIREPFYILKNVFDENNDAFKLVSDVPVIPSTLSSIQKSIFAISVIVLRIKVFQIQLRQQNGNVIDSNFNSSMLNTKSESLLTILMLCAKSNMEQLKKMSKKYYIAWRLHKVHDILFSIIKSDSFYVENNNSILRIWSIIDEDMLDTMLEELTPLNKYYPKYDTSKSYDDSLINQNCSIIDATEINDFWPSILKNTNNTSFSLDDGDFNFFESFSDIFWFNEMENDFN